MLNWSFDIRQYLRIVLNIYENIIYKIKYSFLENINPVIGQSFIKFCLIYDYYFYLKIFLFYLESLFLFVHNLITKIILLFLKVLIINQVLDFLQITI